MWKTNKMWRRGYNIFNIIYISNSNNYLTTVTRTTSQRLRVLAEREVVTETSSINQKSLWKIEKLKFNKSIYSLYLI